MRRDGVAAWPAPAARTYRTAGLWRGRPLGAVLWDWADRWPDRTALVDGERRLTYLELARRADALAERLAARGLGRGDSVLLALPNCWELVAVTLACVRLGVAPVMMLPAHREHEMTAIGRHVGARALVVPDRVRDYDHRALARRVACGLDGPVSVLVVGEEVADDEVDLRALLVVDGDPDARRRRLDERAPDASDVALFLLSGGTTGLPKLIGRTHDDYEYNIRRSAEVCGFGADTVYLVALPAGHNFPLGCPGILGTFAAGGRVVVLPSARPDAVAGAIEAEGVTATAAVPAVVSRWMEYEGLADHDLSSLRQVQVGGSILARELAARIGPRLGCRLQQVFGMAEGLLCFTPLDGDETSVLTTQGRPMSEHDELLVVDADDRPVATGEVGELLVRGPYTPRGYYDAPEQNAQAFTAEGYYRTGDLVRRTPRGEVVVCGRTKDLVNRGGEKISAHELETLVLAMPEVREAALVAQPDPEVGERACLFVVLREGTALALDDVAAGLRERGLAPFKIPERLEVVDDLPRTAVGKPDKKALRALAARPSTRRAA